MRHPTVESIKTPIDLQSVQEFIHQFKWGTCHATVEQNIYHWTELVTLIWPSWLTGRKEKCSFYQLNYRAKHLINQLNRGVHHTTVESIKTPINPLKWGYMSRNCGAKKLINLIGVCVTHLPIQNTMQSISLSGVHVMQLLRKASIS